MKKVHAIEYLISSRISEKTGKLWVSRCFTSKT